MYHDTHNYKRRLEGQLRLLKMDPSISEKNKKLILKFILYSCHYENSIPPHTSIIVRRSSGNWPSFRYWEAVAFEQLSQPRQLRLRVFHLREDGIGVFPEDMYHVISA